MLYEVKMRNGSVIDIHANGFSEVLENVGKKSIFTQEDIVSVSEKSMFAQNTVSMKESLPVDLPQMDLFSPAIFDNTDNITDIRATDEDIKYVLSQVKKGIGDEVRNTNIDFLTKGDSVNEQNLSKLESKELRLSPFQGINLDNLFARDNLYTIKDIFQAKEDSHNATPLFLEYSSDSTVKDLFLVVGISEEAAGIYLELVKLNSRSRSQLWVGFSNHIEYNYTFLKERDISGFNKAFYTLSSNPTEEDITYNYTEQFLSEKIGVLSGEDITYLRDNLNIAFVDEIGDIHFFHSSYKDIVTGKVVLNTVNLFTGRIITTYYEVADLFSAGKIGKFVIIEFYLK